MNFEEWYGSNVDRIIRDASLDGYSPYKYMKEGWCARDVEVETLRRMVKSLLKYLVSIDHFDRWLDASKDT